MSDSENELETSGTVDWPAVKDIRWDQLDTPSLGLYILFEVLQFGFIIFFYAVLSFMPELYIVTVNRFFWTKVILEVILSIMSWVFIYINVSYFYTGLFGMEGRDPKRTKTFWVGGTGTIGFIVYVFLSFLSVGYSIMYLIWGGIDTAKLPSSYQRTWQIILLVIVFLEVIGIILETIFIGWYLRRMFWWMGWTGTAAAASRAQFLAETSGENVAEKFLNENYGPSMIKTLNKWGGGDAVPLNKKRTRGLWKRSDVKFGGKPPKTGAYIV